MASSPAMESYISGELTSRGYAVEVRGEANAEILAQLRRRLQELDIGGTAAQESVKVISPESEEPSA